MFSSAAVVRVRKFAEDQFGHQQKHDDPALWRYLTHVRRVAPGADTCNSEGVASGRPTQREQDSDVSMESTPDI
jgi:hypothetical protein